MQKQFCRSVEPLGAGAVEGIAAAEAANNAAAAGAFAPLLALGIPGSGTGAVLLGGLMMWGLNPGPLLFANHPDFAWGLIASLFIANILTLTVSLLVIPWIIKVVKVPIRIMIPAITVVCFIGAYSTSSSVFGVFIMMISGFLGYVMKKYGYPPAPLVLAFVLAKTFEVNMRRSFMISMGDLSIFTKSTISIVLLMALLVMIIVPLVKKFIHKCRIRKLKFF
jgi:putative tricarboxylic transport membrane protein